MKRWLVVPGQPNADRVRGDERARDHGEVDEHLDQPPPVDGEGLREPTGSPSRDRPPLDVGEEARELHEQREA